nr:LysR family transcriptional regulator [Pseudomonas aeruginosa]
MRIRHLRYFLVVAEELNFSRAAERIHIEPSPLSRAMRDLEVELGVHLFQRTRGRIRLTWAGEVFREEAHRMLTFMDGARTRVRAAASGYRGRRTAHAGRVSFPGGAASYGGRPRGCTSGVSQAEGVQRRHRGDVSVCPGAKPGEIPFN